jgi:hypothetical protein
VVDWIAYGHALRTEKGASKTFGTGDVRGVIATETANNSKEGGSLVTTIAFGVPGSASMALLLGAFVVYGIVPGPQMLSRNLDITYSLVWSIVIANIVGAALCFLFVKQLAKVALIRPGILVPLILAITFIGAYQARTSWMDIYILISAGVLCFTMKRLGWARPPLLLGFVLGGIFERYMFLSVNIYGLSWLTRPVVMVILALAVYGLMTPIYKRWREARRLRQEGHTVRYQFGWRSDINRFDLAFTLLILALFVITFLGARDWHFDARLVPQVISTVGGLFCVLLIISQTMLQKISTAETTEQPAGDLSGEFAGMELTVVVRRAAEFLAALVGYIVLSAVVGLLPALPIFVLLYMVLIGKERWIFATVAAVCLFTFCYLLFHQVLNVVWPQALLGEYLPMFRDTRALRLM